MADDLKELLAIIHGQGRDDQAPFAAAAGGGDEALLLEAVQRASYWRAAQPKPLGDDALGDARAGWELSPDDDAAQVVVRARAVVESRAGVGVVAARSA